MEDSGEQNINNIIEEPKKIAVNAAEITKKFKSIKDRQLFCKEMSKINSIIYRSLFPAGTWIRHNLLFTLFTWG